MKNDLDPLVPPVVQQPRDARCLGSLRELSCHGRGVTRVPVASTLAYAEYKIHNTEARLSAFPEEPHLESRMTNPIARVTHVLLWLAMTQLAGCWESRTGRDTALEKRARNTFLSMRAQSASSVPLRDLLLVNEGKLCVQRPFMTRATFEAGAQASIASYASIADDSHVWWLIEPNGRQRWIVIPRMEVADLDRTFGRTCADIGRGELRINRSSSITTYSFED